jgi:hypothetical protein
MPEKRMKKGCGKRCTLCWQNKLKHSAKASFKGKKVFNKKTISGEEAVPTYMDFGRHINIKPYTPISECYYSSFSNAFHVRKKSPQKKPKRKIRNN